MITTSFRTLVYDEETRVRLSKDGGITWSTARLLPPPGAATATPKKRTRGGNSVAHSAALNTPLAVLLRSMPCVAVGGIFEVNLPDTEVRGVLPRHLTFRPVGSDMATIEQLWSAVANDNNAQEAALMAICEHIARGLLNDHTPVRRHVCLLEEDTDLDELYANYVSAKVLRKAMRHIMQHRAHLVAGAPTLHIAMLALHLVLGALRPPFRAGSGVVGLECQLWSTWTPSQIAAWLIFVARRRPELLLAKKATEHATAFATACTFVVAPSDDPLPVLEALCPSSFVERLLLAARQCRAAPFLFSRKRWVELARAPQPTTEGPPVAQIVEMDKRLPFEARGRFTHSFAPIARGLALHGMRPIVWDYAAGHIATELSTPGAAWELLGAVDAQHEDMWRGVWTAWCRSTRVITTPRAPLFAYRVADDASAPPHFHPPFEAIAQACAHARRLDAAASSLLVVMPWLFAAHGGVPASSTYMGMAVTFCTAGNIWARVQANATPILWYAADWATPAEWLLLTRALGGGGDFDRDVYVTLTHMPPVHFWRTMPWVSAPVHLWSAPKRPSGWRATIDAPATTAWALLAATNENAPTWTPWPSFAAALWPRADAWLMRMRSIWKAAAANDDDPIPFQAMTWPDHDEFCSTPSTPPSFLGKSIFSNLGLLQ